VETAELHILIKYILIGLVLVSLLMITYAQIGNYLINKDFLYPEECVSIPEDIKRAVRIGHANEVEARF